MKTLLMTLAAAGAAGCVTPALAQVGYYGDYAPASYAPAGYAANYAYGRGYAAPSGGHYDFAGDHLDYDPSPVHGAAAVPARPAFAPSHGGYGYGALNTGAANPAYPSYRRPVPCGTGYPTSGCSAYGRRAGYFGLGW